MNHKAQLPDLKNPPFLRDCAVEFSARPSEKHLRSEVLRLENVEKDFSLVTAPLPAQHQTLFKWSGNDKVLVLAVACIHAVHASDQPGGYEDEALELFLDLKNDGIGFQQFVIGSDGSVQEYSHLPYPEMHSSSYPLLHPTKVETFTERFAGDFLGAGCRWFLIWFDTPELFRSGQTLGFNLARTRGSGETSSWNYASGNGLPDATCFGRLHQKKIPETKSEKKPPSKPRPVRDFILSLTYDPPRCVVANHYTPQRLHDEMAIVKSWGIDRLHWIDNSNWASFWEHALWAKGAKATQRHCGELLACAVKQARANDMEFIADLKLFDLGFNTKPTNRNPRTGGAPDIENHLVSVIPEIAARQEWTMRASEEWIDDASQPVAKLTWYSDTPFREVLPEQVQLLVSDDNRTYRPYRGKSSLRQGSLQRPHGRWTPAGVVDEELAVENWFLEISSLNLTQPFVALRIEGENVTFTQRGFMVIEAEDNAGGRRQLTVATKSTPEDETKYLFWKDWPGWSNITEPLLQRRNWNANDFGVAMKPTESMPTLLEATNEGARKIWLDRIANVFDHGADGVSLRILCHHNGVMNYLQFAFAPVVVEQFIERFGREPQATAEDYEKIRRLRGEAFTQFLRDARDLATLRDKKLMVQLESGIEVPPHLDTRMQMELDWRTWLKEKLVDEISLKFWTPYNRWVQDEVLPLAKKQKIPVHIISRNLNGLLDARAAETLPQLISDTHCLGFDGFVLYEAANVIEMNSEGVSMPKSMAPYVMERVRHELGRNGW